MGWRAARCHPAQVPRPKKDNLQLLRAAAEVWDEDEPDIGYLTRLLTQTNLPYKDPGDIPVWSRHNGSVQRGAYAEVSTDPGTSKASTDRCRTTLRSGSTGSFDLYQLPRGQLPKRGASSCSCDDIGSPPLFAELPQPNFRDGEPPAALRPPVR